MTAAKKKTVKPADKVRGIHTLKIEPDTLPARDPGYSWAYQCASDSSEHAQIHRSLEDGNGPDGPEGWDPMCDVYFAHGRDPFIHPGDEPADVGDGWQRIRWSAVNTMIEGLLDARDAAIRTGMLPPPLTDEQYSARVAAVRKLTAAK